MSFTKKGTIDVPIGRIRSMQISIVTDIGVFQGVCQDENAFCSLLDANDTITDVILDILNSGIKERISADKEDDIYFGT